MKINMIYIICIKTWFVNFNGKIDNAFLIISMELTNNPEIIEMRGNMH